MKKTTQSTSKRKSSEDEDSQEISSNNERPDYLHEAKKLKHMADKQKTSEPKEARELYLQAGIKFLEHCHSLEVNNSLVEAERMYRETADFLGDVAAQSRDAKDKHIASLCYTCIASSLAKSLTLKHDKLRQLKEELHQIDKSTNSLLVSHSKEMDDMLKYFDIMYKAEQAGSVMFSIPTVIASVRKSLK